MPRRAADPLTTPSPPPAPALDVVGIGLATADVLIRLEAMPTWEHGGRFEQIAIDGGGPVATALVAASRLGLRAGYVGTAGDDEFGKRKMLSLVENGVDTAHVRARPGPERQVVLCHVRAGDGERVFSGCQEFSHGDLRPEELDRGYVCGARFLHLDGFHYQAAVQAAQWARERGVTVVLDGHSGDAPISEAQRDLIRLADVFIGGSGSFKAVTGVADWKDAGLGVLSLGPRIAVQTLGRDGCDTVTAEQAFHTPAFDVDVVDTTGAGDVFHGAFIAGLHYGWELSAVVQFACAVSAMKCRAMGGRAGIPTLEQARKFLTEQGVGGWTKREPVVPIS